MAEARTQVLVALIGVTGVLGAALITNPDILRDSGRSSETSPTTPVEPRVEGNLAAPSPYVAGPDAAVASVLESAAAPVPAIGPTQADLLRGLRLSKGEPAPDTSVRPVSIWLAFPAGEGEAIRSVRYEFYHPTFKSPKFSEQGNRTFLARWNGYGCISDAAVIATVSSGEEVRAPFDFCDLWNNGRLTTI